MDTSRRSARLAAILPMKVLVGPDPQVHYAYTMDISTTGVRVILPEALDPGCDVVLEYKNNRAQAVVAWCKPMKKGSSDYAIGMRLLDDGQRFWLVELAPKMQILASMGQSDTEPKRSGDRNSGS